MACGQRVVAGREWLHGELQRRGRGLWECLFPGEVGEGIVAALRADRRVQRLVLETDSDLLLALPLEAAIPPEATWGIGADPGLQVVRRVPGPAASPEAPPGPLRVVVAIESPDEDEASGPLLNFEAEQWVLLRALDEPLRQGRAFAEFLDEGHLGALTDALKRFSPQVVHITGHGGPGGLVFEGPEGEERVVTATQLAGHLAACEGLRLAVTSACLSGATARRDGATLQPAVARALVAAGLPAVLAMQASVSDAFATAFMGEFYRALGAGQSPQEALTAARQNLGPSTLGDEALGEWAVPVLYEGRQPVALYDPQRTQALPERRKWAGWEGVSYRQPGEFTGRRDEKRRALKALRAGKGVIWHGLGGVGKSAFSAHVAERLVADRNCHVIVLRSQITPAEVMQAVERRLTHCLLDASDEPERAHLEKLRRGLLPEGGLDEEGRWEWLRERVLAEEPFLLLLDNFEDNLADVPTRDRPDASIPADPTKRYSLADPALDECLSGLVVPHTQARFLFTSRYPFGLGPSRHLLGLAEMHLGPLSPAEARKLMYHLPNLRGLTMAEKDHVYETIGGHPRCLEYLDSLLGAEGREWGDVAPGLEAVMDGKVPNRKLADGKLNEALSDVIARQAEDVLLGRLVQRVANTPAEKVLKAASVYRRPVDRLGLELVSGVELAEADLRRLEGLTLIWEEGDLWQVPQATATALLRDLPEDQLKAYHTGAARYWEHLARNFAGDLGDWLEARHHLLQTDDQEKAHDIAMAAESVLSLHGHVREAETLALETYELAKAEGLVASLGEAANRLGQQAHRRGAVPEAIARYEECRALYVSLDDRRGEGNALGNLGSVYLVQGDVSRAIQHYEQHLLLARQIGDRRGEGSALSNLGAAHKALGDATRAKGYYLQAMPVARQTGDRQFEADLLGNLGNACAALGDAPRASGYYDHCLAIHRQIGDRRGEGADLVNLGNAHAQLGDARRASRCYEQCLVIARETGDLRAEGWALTNLGSACLSLGDASRAMACSEEALRIMRETGTLRGEGNARGNLGDACFLMGHVERAIAHYLEALQAYRGAGDRQGEAYALGSLGEAYAYAGNGQRAVEFAGSRLAIVREIGDRREEVAALVGLGNARSALGDSDGAIECYERALATSRQIRGHSQLPVALGNLGTALRAAGDLEGAALHLRDGLRLAAAARDPVQTPQLAWQSAGLRSEEGDMAAAVALHAFAFSRFAAMRLPWARAAAHGLAQCRAHMGDEAFTEALDGAEDRAAGILTDLAGRHGEAIARPLRVSWADVQHLLAAGPSDESTS